VLLEVMDKELTIPQMWAIGAVGGVVGYLAGRWRVWAAIPVVLVLAFLPWAAATELSDPYVGPAIIREAGRSYPVQLAASFGIGILLTAAGAWRRVRGEFGPSGMFSHRGDRNGDREDG
jgi:hypothetical protein